MTDFDEADKVYFTSITKDDRAIPLAIISIVVWMDPDTGERRYKIANDTDIPLTDCLGLLDIAKLELIMRTTPEIFQPRE